MSKGARTVVDLEKEVALLRTRDSARAREIRAVRAELTAIEKMLNEPLIGGTVTICSGSSVDAARQRTAQILPATSRAPALETPITGATAGAPVRKLGFFLRRLFGA